MNIRCITFLLCTVLSMLHFSGCTLEKHTKNTHSFFSENELQRHGKQILKKGSASKVYGAIVSTHPKRLAHILEQEEWATTEPIETFERGNIVLIAFDLAPQDEQWESTSLVFLRVLVDFGSREVEMQIHTNAERDYIYKQVKQNIRKNHRLVVVLHALTDDDKSYIKSLKNNAKIQSVRILEYLIK